jgi:hypothetical protein
MIEIAQQGPPPSNVPKITAFFSFLRPVVIMTEPWEYPLYIAAGAYIGYKYPALEAKLYKEVRQGLVTGLSSPADGKPVPAVAFRFCL